MFRKQKGFTIVEVFITLIALSIVSLFITLLVVLVHFLAKVW
jgi:prepilin-type N-terminal cleavage/methylation domain-containing protein